MWSATRRPEVRWRLAEVLHLLRPPVALFGPSVLARLAWDRLAGTADTGNRKATPLREETGGRSRLLRRTVADPDVMMAEGSRG
jgi:hypothetical protein